MRNLCLQLSTWTSRSLGFRGAQTTSHGEPSTVSHLLELLRIHVYGSVHAGTFVGSRITGDHDLLLEEARAHYRMRELHQDATVTVQAQVSFHNLTSSFLVCLCAGLIRILRIALRGDVAMQLYFHFCATIIQPSGNRSLQKMALSCREYRSFPIHTIVGRTFAF
ncbi:hypothetical protein BDN67DRAFT_82098 [Paxillus ammoniavirescens]|nr:hypothetical protein BDN67DRAFT_82098 [Paxillus ammoniavirescens]